MNCHFPSPASNTPDTLNPNTRNPYPKLPLGPAVSFVLHIVTTCPCSPRRHRPPPHCGCVARTPHAPPQWCGAAQGQTTPQSAEQPATGTTGQDRAGQGKQSRQGKRGMNSWAALLSQTKRSREISTQSGNPGLWVFPSPPPPPQYAPVVPGLHTAWGVSPAPPACPQHGQPPPPACTPAGQHKQ